MRRFVLLPIMALAVAAPAGAENGVTVRVARTAALISGRSDGQAILIDATISCPSAVSGVPVYGTETTLSLAEANAAAGSEDDVSAKCDGRAHTYAYQLEAAAGRLHPGHALVTPTINILLSDGSERDMVLTAQPSIVHK